MCLLTTSCVCVCVCICECVCVCERERERERERELRRVLRPSGILRSSRQSMCLL